MNYHTWIDSRNDLWAASSQFQRSENAPIQTRPSISEALEDDMTGLSYLQPPSNTEPRQPEILYEKLPFEDSFRLLEVLPGDFGAEITCRLHHARLSNHKLRYEALSYCWEIYPPYDLKHKEVECCGHSVPVGENLWNALQRIRHGTLSRLIWADSLCIDQANIVEKSVQVRKMHTIYRKASRVLVWLGEKAYLGDNPEEALAAVCRIVNSWKMVANLYTEQGRATFTSFADSRRSYTCHTKNLDSPIPSTSETWNAIRFLYFNSWFERLWVIQEVALASHAVVMLRDLEISWKWIGLAAAVIRANFTKIVWNQSELQMTVSRGILNAYFIYRISLSQDVLVPLSLSFHQLIVYTRHFICKDPRDQVYGLLGIPTIDTDPEIEKLFIEPDYNLTAVEVREKVAFKVLHTSEALDLLSTATGISEKETTRFLELETTPISPTWVPNWHKYSTTRILPTEASGSFQPAGDRPMAIEILKDKKQFRIRGIEISVVSGVTETLRRNLFILNDARYHRGHRGRYGSPLVRVESPSWMPGKLIGRGVLSALGQGESAIKESMVMITNTLTAGKDWYGIPHVDEEAHIADYAQCLLEGRLIWSFTLNPWVDQDRSKDRNKNYEPKPVPTDGVITEDAFGTEVVIDGIRKLAEGGTPAKFIDAAITACAGRRLFETTSGILGLGPSSLVPGDVICVLYGARVPFVLRPVGLSYAVVGECYVRDLMKGQALQYPADDGASKEKWFTIL